MNEPSPSIQNELVGLLGESISKIQKRLIERNKIQPVSVEEMRSLLEAEKKNKNRSGLREWLEFGIKTGALAGDFFLGYQERMSCLKSGLQKYIRRSRADEAVRTGKALWRMGREQAIRRLKVVIPEDSHLSIGLLNHFSDDMDEATFISVVHTVAEAPKDKSSCVLAVEMDQDKSMNAVIPDVDFIKANLMRRDLLPFIARQVFVMSKQKRHSEIVEVLGGDKVVRELIGRQEAGTFFSDDGMLLIVSAIRYAQQDYDPSIKPIPVNPNDIRPIELHELHEFTHDFHCPVGKVAERIFLSRHKDIDPQRLRRAWFLNLSGKLEGQVIPSSWEDQDRDTDFWNHCKDEIQGLVRWCMVKFQLELYDGRGAA